MVDASWIGLVPLLPALSAGWIGIALLGGWQQGERGERVTARVALWGVGLALGLLLLLDLDALLLARTPGSIALFPWMDTVGYRVMVSFILDPLGLALSTLAALLCWLTVRFAVCYLHREAAFQRFFASLSLFASGLLLFLLAGNAVLAFVGWELMGLTSYLLIGYANERSQATGNATRVLLTNRIGDAGFLAGILFSYVWLGGGEWGDIAGGFALLSSLQLGILAGGFVLAALVKSAQFPFAAWVGRALEGPTPSSAAFYGALMIHAGVFLLLRLQDLIAQSPFLMVVLCLLGLLTVLYGLLVGLVQTDVKSGLIAAGQTQVGWMFLACGLGWFDWAAWHLAAHAGWRLYQVLNAPSYMHLLPGPTRPVWVALHRRQGLYAAAIARFWLDPLTDVLITRPTQNLARDLQSLDDNLVNRLLGNGAMERILFGQLHASRPTEKPGHRQVQGVGLFGALLEALANRLQWLEQLVLRMGGEGSVRSVAQLGDYLLRIDRLFSEPRYLVLMILITFVVAL
ncbi:MAG: hypothetical protein HQL90_02155 [Magnetococcales bacterium]|nr:hypothetical protein [Magnetococcales bacterium]